MTATPARKSSRLLIFIGVIKLVKAAVLFAGAYALHYLRHTDVGQTLVEWARRIHFDPDGKYLHRLIDNATNTSPGKLHLAGIGLFVYAVLFSIEGGGLLARKRWGEYVTVVITSLLLPLELYELFEPGHKLSKVLLLAANLAIVAYLIWNLVRTSEPTNWTKRASPVPDTEVASSAVTGDH